MPYPSAEAAVRALGGRTIAVAESLTGGYVCGALASVPGVSAILRGGVVAYSPDAKAGLLGVDPGLIARGGTVQREVALQMAEGVAIALDAQFGLGTTGIAGPGPSEGHEAGECFIAVIDRGSGAREVRFHRFDGNREQVRRSCETEALQILSQFAEQIRPNAC